MFNFQSLSDHIIYLHLKLYDHVVKMNIPTPSCPLSTESKSTILEFLYKIEFHHETVLVKVKQTFIVDAMMDLDRLLHDDMVN